MLPKSMNDTIIKFGYPENHLKSILGHNIQLKLNYVESLFTDGGKIRNVINKIEK